MQRIFDSYFQVFPWDSLEPDAVGFDLGCGTGRWAKLVAPRVGTLHCIDPSSAIDVARSHGVYVRDELRKLRWLKHRLMQDSLSARVLIELCNFTQILDFNNRMLFVSSLTHVFQTVHGMLKMRNLDDPYLISPDEANLIYSACRITQVLERQTSALSGGEKQMVAIRV